MNASELRELIKQELPQLVREDAEIQDLILRLSRQEFAHHSIPSQPRSYIYDIDAPGDLNKLQARVERRITSSYHDDIFV